MAARRAPDPAIRDLLRSVDRRRFLPAELHHLAHEDRPLPIGHGQTNSQPSTVGDMLWLLEVSEGHRVLDVGSGSGWTTALLAHLVGPTGRVLGVELVPELASTGAANLATFDLPWASIRAADPAVLGAPGEAPFDRILVSAGADELPGDLVDQLAEDGVLVVPVEGRMLKVRRTAGGATEVSEHGTYSFVPLLVEGTGP